MKISFAGIFILIAIVIVVFIGCIESKDVSAEIPVKVVLGTTPSQSNDSNYGSLYLQLYDSSNNQTTSDGIAEITFLKGRINENQGNESFESNITVYRQRYNLNASEFKKENNQIGTFWKTDLPNVLEIYPGVQYMVNISFQPRGSNNKLMDSIYIVPIRTDSS